MGIDNRNKKCFVNLNTVSWFAWSWQRRTEGVMTLGVYCDMFGSSVADE